MVGVTHLILTLKTNIMNILQSILKHLVEWNYATDRTANNKAEVMALMEATHDINRLISKIEAK